MEVNAKVCIKCKGLFTINAENFHRNSRLKDGFLNACKTCHNEYSSRRRGGKTATKICKKCNKTLRISDFGNASSTLDGKRDWCYICHDAQVKENDAKKLAKAKNYRRHRTIVLNEDCTVKRLSIVGRGQDGILKGKFIKEYESFLVFQHRTGIKECFRKNDINIDWGIV